ncbi:MAG TPA: glycosyltransferase family 2 protein, partial [Chthoniobacterales bacterium]
GSLRSGFSLPIVVPSGSRILRLEAERGDDRWQEFFTRRIRGPLFTFGRNDVSSRFGNYSAWISCHDTLTRADRRWIARDVAQLQRRVTFSVLLPTYNPEPRILRRAIESVRRQLYPHWELCVVDDASTDGRVIDLLRGYARRDSRIKVQFRPKNGHVSVASNDALASATGEYIALLDHDDELESTALYLAARALNRADPPLLLYSDEDKLDRNGHRFEPNFKPDWNPDLFLSQNYISHLGIYATALVRRVGGFRVGFEGAQDYDLTLRCIEQLDPSQIAHIPHVLYHWHSTEETTAAWSAAKPYALDAAVRAVQEHIVRVGINARVEPHRSAYQRVIYLTPPGDPLVSLIIPTRDRAPLLRRCVESILAKTGYRNFELVILDNDSSEPDALAYLDSLGSDQIRVVRAPGDFNYSRMNNLGVQQAQGSFIALLNNDLEVIEPDWLREMLSHAARPEIGAVGARLWYPNGTLQHGGVIVGAGGVASHAHAELAKNEPGYFSRAQLTQNFSAVTAACMLLRRDVYLQVGGFDEVSLPVAFNDVDFCLRLTGAGWRIVWTPFAELIHHESASRGYEDTIEKHSRFQAEVEYMKQKWAGRLENDPAFNPNLSLGEQLFTLAFPPRIRKPWQDR